MADKFEVIWEAEDGYVGGSRPHRFKIYCDDFSECSSDEDLEEMLYSAVDEEFHQKVSYDITNRDEVLEWMKARRDEMKSG